MLSGRMLQTFFFGLASLVVVFAPSSLARFDRQSAASFAYTLLIKSMSLANTVVFNPVVLLAIVIIGIMLLRKNLRVRLFEQCGCWLLMFVFMIGIVCFLGEGAERTSWPVTVLALIILLRLMPLDRLQMKLSVLVTSMGIGLAVLTFAYSTYGVVRTRVEHENAVEAWRINDTDLCAIPDNPDSLLGFLFDRSLPARSLVWFGPTSTKNMNPALAAKYNRKVLLGLPADTLTAFGNGASFCAEERRLKIGDEEWFADPDHDILVRPLGNKGCELDYGKELTCKINYQIRPGLSYKKFTDILRYDLDRFAGGMALFKTSNFFQTFSRDIIYATIYASSAAKGFTVKTDAGWYLIVQNNRFNNRNQIESIVVR